MSDDSPSSDRPLSRAPTRVTPARAIPVGIGGGVLLVLAVGGSLIWRAESKVNNVALAESAKPVTTTEAKAATYRATRMYVGTLEPWVAANIGPQFISAYIDTVLVRPGAIVKRNEVLATLDCRNASATNQAVAMEARAIDSQQKAIADEAARLRGLLDGGFVSQNESEMKTALSEAQQAQLLSQKAKMENAALDVSDCILRAPFEGEIATRTQDPGGFVRPGVPIVSIVDRSIVRVVGYAPEIDFDIVKPGTPVVIHVLGTGSDIKGSIARRAPAANPSSRTVHFEIDIPDPKQELPVDTTGEIRIEVGEPIVATMLPLYAAAIQGEKAVVFVIEGDVAHSRVVPVKGEIGGRLYLDPSLAPGSRVVVEGRALLEDGDRVAMKPSPTAAASTPGSHGSADKATQ
jgi:membrane fusion protein (multidrug efflux system)